MLLSGHRLPLLLAREVHDFSYPNRRIHGTGIFTCCWLIFIYGISVSKYTNLMDLTQSMHPSPTVSAFKHRVSVSFLQVEIVGDDLYCTNTKRVQMGLGIPRFCLMAGRFLDLRYPLQKEGFHRVSLLRKTMVD